MIKDPNLLNDGLCLNTYLARRIQCNIPGDSLELKTIHSLVIAINCSGGKSLLILSRRQKDKEHTLYQCDNVTIQTI